MRNLLEKTSEVLESLDLVEEEVFNYVVRIGVGKTPKEEGMSTIKIQAKSRREATKKAQDHINKIYGEGRKDVRFTVLPESVEEKVLIEAGNSEGEAIEQGEEVFNRIESLVPIRFRDVFLEEVVDIYEGLKEVLDVEDIVEFIKRLIEGTEDRLTVALVTDTFISPETIEALKNAAFKIKEALVRDKGFTKSEVIDYLTEWVEEQLL